MIRAISMGARERGSGFVKVEGFGYGSDREGRVECGVWKRIYHESRIVGGGVGLCDAEP